MSGFGSEAKHHVAVDRIEERGDSPDHKTHYDLDSEFTLAEQRKIVHRIDRRLVVTVGVMYCVSLMDRTNLSAAAIAGMTVDLALNVGFRYVSILAFLQSPEAWN